VQYDPPSYTNRIHRDDCLGVLEWLHRRQLAGAELAPVYLASDDEPAPAGDVARWLAAELGVPEPPAAGGGGGGGGRPAPGPGPPTRGAGPTRGARRGRAEQTLPQRSAQADGLPLCLPELAHRLSRRDRTVARGA
jgi:hypothetical protein